MGTANNESSAISNRSQEVSTITKNGLKRNNSLNKESIRALKKQKSASNPKKDAGNEGVKLIV